LFKKTIEQLATSNGHFQKIMVIHLKGLSELNVINSYL